MQTWNEYGNVEAIQGVGRAAGQQAGAYSAGEKNGIRCALRKKGGFQMVKQISEAEFEAEVLKSDKPVLVDFYADWCGPCKMTAPVLDKLAEMVDAVGFAKINVDENPNLAAKYQVMTIPNLVVFKNGELVTRAIGAQNLDALKALVEKAL